jgi:hypothetical protein
LFARAYLGKKNHKKRAGGVAQCESPEFKPWYCQKKKKRKEKEKKFHKENPIGIFFEIVSNL